MDFARRRFLQTAGAAALAAAPRAGFAQSYPTRPIRLIVGQPAGTAPDTIARLVAGWLGQRLGQPVVVENRPGAGLNLATELVVHAAPDGYTLLLSSLTNAINATLYEHLPFDFVRDIAPVAFVGDNAFVMVVTPSFPATSVAEFIAYAKANPGKINFASGGVGTSGIESTRFDAVTPRARTLPVLMCPIGPGRLSNSTCTWPASRSVSAGAPPRYGT